MDNATEALQEAAAQWRDRLRTTRRLDRPAAAMGSARAYAALVASALQSMETRLAAVSKGAASPTGGTSMASSFVSSEHLMRDATRIYELLDPDAVLRSGPCSVVEWLESLPTACASVGLYSQSDVVSVCSSISHPITALLHLLDRVSSDGTLAFACFAPSVEDHLRLALDAMRAMCVSPTVVADEMLATMLYTMEAPVGGTLANAKLFGPKRCFYAVMNSAVGTFHDAACTPLTAEEEIVLRRTIGIFLPLLVRVECFLARLPLTRRTVYRFICADLPSSQYGVGSNVLWATLSSTGDHNARGSACEVVFVLHVHQVSVIDFVSAIGGKGEWLLLPYTWVKVAGMMSPTLQRMLGSRQQFVEVHMLGDVPSEDELVERVLTSQNMQMKELYKPYLEKYVEARVAAAPPPAMESERLPLFDAITQFLHSPYLHFMLLMGEAGAGKTSAALAIHSHLSCQHLTIDGRRVMSVFVPLPAVLLPSRPMTLDAAVQTQLGVDAAGMAVLCRRCFLVLLLDSLDECVRMRADRFRELLGTTECVGCAHTIVSCRSEFLSEVRPPTRAVVADASQCRTLYVQPLREVDVAELLRRVEVQEHVAGVADAVMRMGISQKLICRPVTLCMAASIALHRLRGLREPPDASSVECTMYEGSVVRLYQEYLRVTAFATGTATAAEYRAMLWGLEDAALTMLDAGDWQLTVSAMKSKLAVHSPGPCAIDRIFQCAPLRFESREDYALCSFTHKSVAEYLCATAHWGRTHAALCHVQRSWTRQEPGVLAFISDLSRTSAAERDRICGLGILTTIRQQQSSVNSGAVSSNGVAIMAAANYPMQFTDLSHLRIAEANLVHADFEGANFAHTEFRNCELHGANFTYANVNSIIFENCTYANTLPPLEGHISWVTSVCFSPDGRQLASGSADESVRVWDLSSGREVKKLEGHTRGVGSVCFSPDGRQLASGSNDESVRVWDLSSGREVKKLEGHTRWVTSVCFSPDGRQLASGSADESVRVWDLSSGREVKKLEGHTRWVTSVCFSPDGRQLASGSADESVRVWDLSSGREVKKLEGHTRWVTSVCFSPDGRQLASGSADESVRVWDLSSGREVKKLEGHTRGVGSVCFSPDGRQLASGSNDESVRVWDLSSGREVKKLEGHTRWVTSVCFSPDGRQLASGSDDESVRVWDLSSGREVKKLEGHTRWVTSVCFSPDGRQLASGSADESVRVWDSSNEFRSDRELVLAAVKQDGSALQYASEELRSDRELVLAAVKQNFLALKYVASALRSDSDFMLAVVKSHGWMLYDAPFELRLDGDFMLAAVKQYGLALKYASDELRSDRDIVLAAVKQNGFALQYASNELRSDRDVMLAAVKQNGSALQYASNELRSGRDIVLAAVKQDGSALQYASNELCSGRDIVLAAVKQNGKALQYASNELRSDRDIVLAAVKQNGSALQYASNEFRSDRDIVLAAVKQYGLTLQYASNELRSDRDIVLAAVKQNGWALVRASEEFRSVRELVLAAVKQNGWVFQCASEEFRSDRELVLAAVAVSGQALQYAASSLRRDPAVVFAAMLQDKGALQYADECLRSNERFLLEVSARSAAAQNTATDTRFTLDPLWDAATAAEFVNEKFAASGMLARDRDASPPVRDPSTPATLLPLVGYRISSIELLSNAECAAATSVLNRSWAPPRHPDTEDQLAVRRVFDALLRESGGSMIVYHGCGSASAARSIAEHGFIKSSLRDDGYFGKGIYTTPNAEYACSYATAGADEPAAVVMCRVCVPSVYFVTLADYGGSNAAGHSKLYGQALKSEEAHFALVSRSTNYEACTPEVAEYCELCVSQVAALCPIAVLWVVEAKDTTAAAPSAPLRCMSDVRDASSSEGSTRRGQEARKDESWRKAETDKFAKACLLAMH